MNLYGYRSIGKSELFTLLNENVVVGRYDIASECQSTGNENNVVCFFKENYKWNDTNHVFDILCKFNTNDIVSSGIGTYYASKNLSKTKIWTGRRGNTEYKINEFYIKDYSIKNIVAISYDDISKTYNKDTQEQIFNILKLHNIKDIKIYKKGELK